MTEAAPWPNFTEQEADAVRRVLMSNRVNYWTGEEGRLFEEEFAAFAGVSHAIAVANGTLALDLALHGLGIGERNGGSHNDEVIVTPRSFIASVSCVVNAGAKPVFADVDGNSQNITPESCAPVITANSRAIICVHLAGWPCDMDGFRELVSGRDIRLIEDCAQAHGARYKGQSVGGLGDVAAWSFCQDKIMTTGGEGGMVTCNDMDLWKKMWAFKDHGKSWDAVHQREHPAGFRWLHEGFGSNWRLTEMQSAIGRVQLSRMAGWHRQRSENAAKMLSYLGDITGPGKPLRIPTPPAPDIEHGYYKFYAFVQPENMPAGLSRDDLLDFFNAASVSCFQGACPEIYREAAFENSGFRPGKPMPIAKKLGQTSLMFLVHPGARIPQRDAALADDISALADRQG